MNTHGSEHDARPVKERVQEARDSAQAGYREGMREGSYVGSSPSSDEIRRDIGRTRGDLDRTLTALEERLRPERIVDRVVDQAMSWVDRKVEKTKESGAPSRAIALVNNRAVPLALIGLGAGWLAAEMLSEKRRPAARRRVVGGEYAVGANGGRAVPPGHSILDDDENFPAEDLHVRPVYSDRTGSKLGYEQTVPGGSSGVTGPAPVGPGGDIGSQGDIGGYGRMDIDAERPGLEIPAEVKARRDQQVELKARTYTPPGRPERGQGPRGSTYGAGSSKGHGMGQRVSMIRHRAEDWAGDVRERASSAWDGMGHAGHALRENAAAATDAVARQSRAACDAACTTYERHPLALGLLTLGAGILAGLALPATRRENEWFGAESDEIYRRARRYGHEAVRRGRHAAGHAGEAAMDAAGLGGIRGPEDVAEAARSAAREVVGAARSAVEAASHAVREEAEAGLHETLDRGEEQSGEEGMGQEEGKRDE